MTLTVEVDYRITAPTISRVTLARRRPQVRDQILSCRRCPLSTSGWVRTPVPYRGPSPAQFAVVGEAPGQQENRAGQPFIGPAGKLLEAMFVEAKLDPHACMYLNTVSCVTGDAWIGGPTPRSAFRRWYVGEFLTLRTAGGHEITVTPNHPILTPHGWVAARDLVEGDDLVSGPFGEEVALRHPDVDNRPSTAQQIFRSLAKTRGAQRIVGSDMDFHGDGTDGYVDVVSLDGELWPAIQPSVGQPFSQHEFTSSSDALLVGLVDGPDAHPSSHVNRVRMRATDSRVRRTDHGGNLLCRHELEPAFEGFCTSAEHNIPSRQVLLDSQRVDVESARQRLQALSPLISLDPLVKVSHRYGADWVYNFVTHQGWYSTNNVVTHNCFPHGTPTDQHVNACKVNVDAQLELASTPWVLLVGGTALRAVREDLASVTLMAGTGFVRGGRAYYTVLHPAYVLRNRQVREQVVEDLARWRDIIEGELSMGSMFATTCARCGNWVDHYDPEGIAWCAVHWRTRQVTVTEREREKVADKGKLVAVTRARLRRGRQGALA